MRNTKENTGAVFLIKWLNVKLSRYKSVTVKMLIHVNLRKMFSNGLIL